MTPVEYLATWLGAWRADRRHTKRLRLWLWHKNHDPGPCDCKRRIEKLRRRRG